MGLTEPRLTIRLGAVRRNYLSVAARTSPAQTGAAVKANAYGLGVEAVASTLWDAGCRQFFVASASEGSELRTVLPDASINVFNGAMPGTLDDLLIDDLTPLLISLEQVRLWSELGRSIERRLPTGLHFDTGLGRTGLTTGETEQLLADPQRIASCDIRHVMSHMASADDLSSAQPDEQLARFEAIRRRLPAGMASFANSAGVYRDPKFHFDLVRPGIALYGGSPLNPDTNPMEPAVVLEAPILQIKSVNRGEQVGYGATYQVTEDTCHVVVPVGYGDGFSRSLSNAGSVAIDGVVCPIVGRVSMDLTVIDASRVGSGNLRLGAPVELIGHHRSIDDVARDAGTIAYEMLTQLGRRYRVNYVDD